MTISEACQLWIEQRVEEELEEGKPYRAIGREIAKEIERIFQTKISPNTLYQRTRRQAGTNVPESATHKDSNKSHENKVEPSHGGKRQGAGRPIKSKQNPSVEDPEPITEAIWCAELAISQLSRIRKDDPKREEAFDEVEAWIKTNRRATDG